MFPAGLVSATARFILPQNPICEKYFIICCQVTLIFFAEDNGTPRSHLAQGKFLTVEPPRAQRSIFLFGGEIPPNKRFFHRGQRVMRSPPETFKRSPNAIGEARNILIRSPSFDQIQDGEPVEPSPDRVRKQSPSAPWFILVLSRRSIPSDLGVFLEAEFQSRDRSLLKNLPFPLEQWFLLGRRSPPPSSATGNSGRKR